MLTLLIAAISGGSSYILTAAMRAYAQRHDLLDRPNARSSHTTPTPRGGGIAIVVATLIGFALSALTNISDTRELVVLAIGTVVIGAIGIMDDSRGVKAAPRLAVHAAVAIWTVVMLNGLPTLQIGRDYVQLGITGSALAVLGIVWSINLFNFMDGIDGLAGSQAVFVFGTAAALLFWRGDHSLGAISLCVSGSIAGFLAWNWPPAKIFMGDVGSGVIGYLVAAVAIASENRRSVPLLAFVIVAGLFIADATVTLLRRRARGERPTEAHRQHAYQRLSRVWNSHRKVTVAALAATAFLALLATAGTVKNELLLPAFCVACVFVAALILTIERRAPM
jgi:Fuc2NAc and GlcNAc transferase